jgi:hypothetical protein
VPTFSFQTNFKGIANFKKDYKSQQQQQGDQFIPFNIKKFGLFTQES